MKREVRVIQFAPTLHHISTLYRLQYFSTMHHAMGKKYVEFFDLTLLNTDYNTDLSLRNRTEPHKCATTDT